MDSLYFLAVFSAVIWYIRNTIFWVYLWQKKEYRLDRLLIHVFETAQGRSLLFSPISFAKWLGVAFYIETIFNDSTVAPFHLFVVAIFVFEAVLVVREVLARQTRYPLFTKKALSLLIVSLGSIALILSFPLVDKFFWLLLIDKLLFFIVGFFVFVHSFPTEIYRDILVNRAIRKMRKHKNVLVIGIAGSYGKSSTKEFLTQVLDEQFVVVATRRNQHTLSGTADTILHKITEKTQIFVVEMGAYGRGEIATMCYVTNPTIGIITGINDQHMSLFRSMKGNIASKNELVASLPQNGIALYNTNDHLVYGMYKKAHGHKVAYTTNDTGGGIHATNISSGKASISFTIHLKDRSFSLKAPLLGEHNVINILPAIYIANHLGMSERDIKHKVASITPLPHTMTRKMTKKGVTVIDDTFNSNPESIGAVVSYMKQYKKKRYIILQPMIELGRNAKEQHIKVGKALANSCDVILLTNKNYAAEIRKGIKEEKGSARVITGSINTLYGYLKKELKRGDIVLSEGKEAKAAMEKLLQ